MCAKSSRFGVFTPVSCTQRFRIEQFAFHHEAMPPHGAPLTMAHISDLHLRRWEPDHESLIETLNGHELDFVFLTGDLLTGAADSAACLARLMAQVRCRYGIFVCRGNWDIAYGPALRRLRSLIDDSGGVLLANESRIVKTHAGPVRIIGLDDLARGWPDFSAVPGPAAECVTLSVLLSHAPLAASLLPQGHHVDLVLSGHTHGGQIRVPLLWRLLLPHYRGSFSDGLYHLGSLRLYVNRGFGCVGVVRVRFNCPAEVALFRFSAPPGQESQKRS
jgi:predicted MPP superfamily phosphohydrolase